MFNVFILYAVEAFTSVSVDSQAALSAFRILPPRATKVGPSILVFTQQSTVVQYVPALDTMAFTCTFNCIKYFNAMIN